MKVLLLNGSRREKGCTYTALCEIAQTLEKMVLKVKLFTLYLLQKLLKMLLKK